VWRFVRPAVEDLNGALEAQGGAVPRLSCGPGLRHGLRGLIRQSPTGAIDRQLEIEHYNTVAQYFASPLELRACPKCFRPFIPQGARGRRRRFCDERCHDKFHNARRKRQQAKLRQARENPSSQT